jgi:hypothetical protein
VKRDAESPASSGRSLYFGARSDVGQGIQYESKIGPPDVRNRDNTEAVALKRSRLQLAVLCRRIIEQLQTSKSCHVLIVPSSMLFFTIDLRDAIHGSFCRISSFSMAHGIGKIEGEIALLPVQGLAGRIDFFFREFSSAAKTEERRRS